jgi:hypothetical protein
LAVSCKQLAMQSVRVINVFGETAMEVYEINAHQSKFPVSGLSAGVYFIEITTTKGKLTKRVVIAR